MFSLTPHDSLKRAHPYSALSILQLSPPHNQSQDYLYFTEGETKPQKVSRPRLGLWLPLKVGTGY